MGHGLAYIGGPLDGQSYHLDAGQPAPLAIRRNEWKGQGYYQLKGERLVWVGK